MELITVNDVEWRIMGFDYDDVKAVVGNIGTYSHAYRFATCGLDQEQIDRIIEVAKDMICTKFSEKFKYEGDPREVFEDEVG